MAAALTALAGRRAGRVRPRLDDKVVAAGNGLADQGPGRGGHRARRAPLPGGGGAGGPLRPRRPAPPRRPPAAVPARRPRTRYPRSARTTPPSPSACFALYRDRRTSPGSPRLPASWRTWWTCSATRRAAPSSAPAATFPLHPPAARTSPTTPAPSDNALAAEALLTLAAYTGDEAARDQAEGVFRAAGPWMERAPAAVGHLLGTLLVALSPPRQLAVVGPPGHPGTRSLLAVAEEQYRPELFVAPGDGVTSGGVSLLEGRRPARRAPGRLPVPRLLLARRPPPTRRS